MTTDIDSRKVVFMVDDDELHHISVESHLENDYQVFKALSGKEALELLNSRQVIPDLILLDILMPEMDGWAVFDKIQDIAALKNTPIMFYSSLDEDSAKEKAYELGAFDFLTKPCPRSILLSRIKDSLEKAEQIKLKYGL